jgi:hypothetical protein
LHTSDHSSTAFNCDRSSTAFNCDHSSTAFNCANSDTDAGTNDRPSRTVRRITKAHSRSVRTVDRGFANSNAIPGLDVTSRLSEA